MYVPEDPVFIDGREKSCEMLQKEAAGILKKNGICVCGTTLSDKFKALSIEQLTAVCKEADVVLIEADGAAHKAAKAPEAWEPAVYAQSNKVVIVMGLHAVGGSVNEVCHRPECVKEALGCNGAHLLTRTDLDVLMEVYEKKVGQLFPGMKTEYRYYKKM